MKLPRNTTSARVLIVLSTALILSIMMATYRLLPAYLGYWALDNQFGGDAEGVDVEEAIDQVLDELSIMLLVSEYQIREESAYPSLQYLTETMSPDHPMFYQKLLIKSEGDNPSTTAWPAIRELHIWPGYACTDEVRRYTADEINYGKFIKKDPENFVLISLSVNGIIGNMPGSDYEYSCSML